MVKLYPTVETLIVALYLPLNLPIRRGLVQEAHAQNVMEEDLKPSHINMLQVQMQVGCNLIIIVVGPHALIADTRPITTIIHVQNAEDMVINKNSKQAFGNI